VAWTCPACHLANRDDALLCDGCGVARRWHEDPPLDLPPPPPWHHVGAAWAAGLYGLLAAAGLAVLAIPGWLAAVGIAPAWVGLEVVLTGAAGVTSAVEAVWRRRFNRAELHVPATLRVGQAFDATLTLVPYATLAGVTVRLELVDRYFVKVVRDGRRQSSARSRVVERHVIELAPLRGRREHTFLAQLVAPLSTASHHDVQSEIVASVLAVFGPFVPGVGHYARNLREHGGFFVRAVVRSGVWRRSYQQRVVPVMVPPELLRS
jgi:hypothetical protein